MALVSVVIPVYKTERYLDRCIQSVLRQSLQELEVLLIDDGSPDRCGEICDAYAKQDSRIQVIHKKNQGLSAARNTGLSLAGSPYVGFVDSDDWVHPRMYEVLLRDLQENGAQIAVCGFQRIFDGEPDAVTLKKPLLQMTGKQALENLLTGKSTGGMMAWNKLYDISLFQDVCYPVGKKYEDDFTTYRLMHKAQKVVFRPAQLYHYQQRLDSIMARGFDRSSMDKIEAANEIIRFMQENAPQFLPQAQCFSIISALRLMVDILDDGGKAAHPVEFARLEQVLRQKQALLNPYLSFRHKFLLRLYRTSPPLYTALWHIRFRSKW